MTPILLRSRPQVVEAMKVEPDTIDAVADWCGGLPTREGVWLPHGTDVTIARLGTTVVRTASGGLRVLAEDAVWADFEAVV